MARVTVQVRVRDLTGNSLNRLNGNFNRLGDSVNRFAGDRTQQNLNAVRRDTDDMGDSLSRLRGRIPEREFERLNAHFTQLRQHAQNLNLNAPAHQLGALRNSLDDFDRQIRRLNRVNAPNIVPNIRPPDGRRTQNRFLRALTSPFRLIGGVLGGTLSDGVGQGLSNGLKAAGPIVGAAFLAAVAGAVSLLGAAIAGALILAIGSAFVGLGGFLALQADGVKQKWAKTLGELKPLFIDAASGLQPVLEHYRHMIGDLAKDFAPHFKEALNAAAPHVQTFLDHVIEGFKLLGQRAAPDLEEAFNVFLDAFGPEVEDTLAGLGDALAALARTVRDHSTEIAAALGIIIKAVTGVVNIVNFLANMWVDGMHSMYYALGVVIGGVKILVDNFLGAVEAILGGLESLVGVIPGFGDALGGAKKAVAELRERTVGDFASMETSFKNAGKTLDLVNKKRTLRVDIESWKNQLRIARADLKRTSDQKARAKIQADISNLQAKIRSARSQLNSLNGKTATTFVRTVYFSEEHKKGPYAPNAHGGVRGLSRAATGGARGNMTLVGEQGPELINLAPGSRVRSNPDSRRLMAQNSNGAQTTIVIDSTGNPTDRLLLQLLRNAVRVEGGDAQIVFGGRKRR